jgi:hypothetical protein
MLALAEILALIVLNALAQAAFARWKTTRRAGRQGRRPTAAAARVSFHYPLHPSPAGTALRFEAMPETAAHVRPAGMDW